MNNLEIKEVVKQYDDHLVVKGVSLTVKAGELVSFLGPSGCGKTTLLRMVAGLLIPNNGSVHIQGRDVTTIPPYKRDIGMVFQNYALFPHLTVEQNVAFGLRSRKVSKPEIKERAKSALEMVNLSGLGGRYPRQLSGGQQQRVALARALVLKPAVLLLDEPLSALDAKLRYETREEIRRLQLKLGLATVFVTHDQEEALAISDRVAVMSNGIVQQFDEPETLFEKPVNEFVARFMGIPNVFPAKSIGNSQYQTNDGLIVDALENNPQISFIGVRPDRITVQSEAKEKTGNCFDGTIEERSYTGMMIRLNIRLESGQTFVSSIPSHTASAQFHQGHRVSITWKKSDTLLLLPEKV